MSWKPFFILDFSDIDFGFSDMVVRLDNIDFRLGNMDVGLREIVVGLDNIDFGLPEKAVVSEKI